MNTNKNTNTDVIQRDSQVNRKDENPFVVLASKLFIIAIVIVIIILIVFVKVENMNILTPPFVVLASKLCPQICLKNIGFEERKKI